MRTVATVELIPFTPGRRPTDEARHPWLGSSDQVAFVLGDRAVDNRCYLLLAIDGRARTRSTSRCRRDRCRAGNGGRSCPRAFVDGEPSRARGRSATTARTCSRSLPTQTRPSTIPFTGLRLDARDPPHA